MTNIAFPDWLRVSLAHGLYPALKGINGGTYDIPNLCIHLVRQYDNTNDATARMRQAQLAIDDYFAYCTEVSDD